MTSVEWHLALNHLPLVGSFIAALILLFGLILKSRVVSRVGLIVFICSALLTIPAEETGEEAEHQLEKAEGLNYSHDLIHEHEELAERFALIARITGVIALGAYFFSFGAGKIGLTLRIITLIGALITAYYGAQTAHEGGKISHPFLRDGQASH